MGRARNVFIIAREGPLRESLRALFSTMPNITTVEVMDDVLMALTAVAEHRPILALLDVDGHDHRLGSIVQQFREQSNGTRIIVLADDIEQLDRAQIAGADFAVIKGIPAAELFQTVERLVSQ